MSDKQWLEKLIHKKYGLIPTDKAQQAIIEIEQRIKQLEDELKRTLKTEQRTAEMNGKLLITIRELKALEGKR